MRGRLFVGLVIMSGIGLVAVILSLWLHRGTSDPTKVHPSIYALKQPYLDVSSGYYGDGGSCEIVIRDATGRVASYWLAHPMGNPAIQGKLFLGHYDDGNMIDEVRYPETRMELLRIVEKYGDRGSSEFLASARLSQSSADKFRVFVKKWLGYYNRP